MQSKLPLLHSCPGGIRKSTFHGPWHWQSAARRPLLQAEFIPSAPIILAIIPQSRKTLTSLRRGKSTTYNGSGGKTREKTVWRIHLSGKRRFNIPSHAIKAASTHRLFPLLQL